MRVFAMGLVLVWLAGCGQTGDLYWPEPEPVIVDEDEVDPDAR